jgi:ribosomal protein S18 acetylase RimI-like enzyme
MRIRAAEAGDIEPVKACVDAAFGSYVARLGRPPAPMLADYGALVAGGKVQVIGEGRVVGLIVYYPRGDHIHVETVAVLPEARGKGFGRALMAHAEAAASRLRLAAVELYTHALMTENITYYNALGYREIRRGDEDGFPRVHFRKPATA